MTALIRFSRAVALAAIGVLAASGAHAQATWDIDACSGGTRNIANNQSTGSSTGYTGCGGSAATNGVTMDVKPYSSSAGGQFAAALINSQSSNGLGYIGVLSGSETTGSNSPHHAVDNVTSPGHGLEAVLLSFSKGVDLGTIVATWTNDAGGDADFMVFRWNNSAASPNMALTPGQMPATVGTAANGWQLVMASDFASSLTQTMNDSNYYSSHWLISTAVGGSNDAFKLGKLTAVNVCSGTGYSVDGAGACNPPGNPPSGGAAPEPTSLALFGLAAFGAGVARRRSRASRGM